MSREECGNAVEFITARELLVPPPGTDGVNRETFYGGE